MMPRLLGRESWELGSSGDAGTARVAVFPAPVDPPRSSRSASIRSASIRSASIRSPSIRSPSIRSYPDARSMVPIFFNSNLSPSYLLETRVWPIASLRGRPMSLARLLRRCGSRRFATVATSEAMPTSRTFYKRVLPPTGVAFSSPRGQEIFKDALGSNMVRVERRASKVERRGSRIQRRASRVEDPAPSVQRPASSVQRPAPCVGLDDC